MLTRTYDTYLRPTALLLAGGLALTANALFTGQFFSRTLPVEGGVWNSRHDLATCCLVAAVAIATMAFGRSQNFPTKLRPRDDASPRPLGRAHLLSFLPCLGLYLAASLSYRFTGETATVRVLWGASLIALFLPLRRRFDWDGIWPVALWEYGLVALITLSGFYLRYVDLTHLAVHFDNDVAIMGRYSRKLLETGDWRLIGMTPTDHQFVEHQFLAMSLRLFGDGQAGLVMVNVVAGAASVPLLYLLGKMMFNRSVGLIAASFLAIDYVHIHFSRNAFGPVATFFLLLSGVCLFHGLRRANPLAFAAAGVAAGLAMLDYYSGRVAPVIYVILFVIWWTQRKSFPRVTLWHWALALGGALVVFGPNLVYAVQSMSKLNGRGREVLLWTNAAWKHASAQYGTDASVFEILGQQIKRTLLSPYNFQDRSTICFMNRPMLGILPGVCLALGVGYFLPRYREVSGGYLLLWVGLTFVCGGILTTNPPFWPHLNIAAPALALLGAVGLERTARAAVRLRFRLAPVMVPAVVVLAVAATAIQNWDVYTAFVRRYAFSESLAIRHIQTMPEDSHVYLMSPHMRWDQDPFQFLLRHVDGQNLRDDDIRLQVAVVDQPTVFMVFPDANQQSIQTLRAKYPSATTQIFKDGWGIPVFTTVQVLPPGYVVAPKTTEEATPGLLDTMGGKLLALLTMAGLFGTSVLARRDQAVRRLAGSMLPNDSDPVFGPSTASRMNSDLAQVGRP